MNLRKLWPYHDSPGFTDYPRNDINTHRRIASINRVFAVVLFFGGIWYASGRADVSVSLPIALAALMYAAALGMQLQALRWEMQLERDARESTDDGGRQ